MASTINVDIVSDTVCPWCYIGKLRLEQAIKQFDGKDVKFVVKWHPYQLNPSAPEQGENKLQMYRSKFGPQVDLIIPRMQRTFAEYGLQYSVGGLTGNTFNSHRLIHWAGVTAGSEAQNKLVEVLFKAYFCEEKYINDKDVLLNAVEQADLSRSEAEAVLSDPSRYKEEVQSALYQARRQGITGVPNFTIDNRYQVSGAQPPEEFLAVFQEVLRNAAGNKMKVEGQACTVGGECL